MKKGLLKAVAQELVKSNERHVEEVFYIDNTRLEVISVKIERRPLNISNESFTKAYSSNTVSALPAGGVCEACNGSGRA